MWLGVQNPAGSAVAAEDAEFGAFGIGKKPRNFKAGKNLLGSPDDSVVVPSV